MPDRQGLGDRPGTESGRRDRTGIYVPTATDRELTTDRPRGAPAYHHSARRRWSVARPSCYPETPHQKRDSVGRCRGRGRSVARSSCSVWARRLPRRAGGARIPPRRTAPRRAGGATRRLGAGGSCFGLVFRWGNMLQAPGTLVMVRMVRLRTMPARAAAVSGEGREGATHRAGPSSGNAQGRPGSPLAAVATGSTPSRGSTQCSGETRSATDRPGGLRSRARKRVQEPHKWRPGSAPDPRALSPAS